MAVACHHCAKPIRHRSDLVTAARLWRLSALHRDCFSARRQANPWSAGAHINSRKGTRRAVLSLALVGALLYLVLVREGIERAYQVPALAGFCLLALLPALNRARSYLQIERYLRAARP